jgi:hypothetical protein
VNLAQALAHQGPGRKLNVAEKDADENTPLHWAAVRCVCRTHMHIIPRISPCLLSWHQPHFCRGQIYFLKPGLVGYHDTLILSLLPTSRPQLASCCGFRHLLSLSQEQYPFFLLQFTHSMVAFNTVDMHDVYVYTWCVKRSAYICDAHISPVRILRSIPTTQLELRCLL